MDARNNTRTCACCSCRCAEGHPEADSSDDEDEDDDSDNDEEVNYAPTTTFPLSQIPNIHLLHVNGIKSEELPRDALTRIGDYCLQPLAIRGEDSNGEILVDICKSCLRDLSKKKVPMSSLVRVDTGAIPEDLLPLSLMEEQLLGLGKACRYIFVMRPRGDDLDLQQWCFRGHVIAFPNVSVKDVRDCFPMRFSDIPKQMQVRSPFIYSVLITCINYSLIIQTILTIISYSGHICHSSQS